MTTETFGIVIPKDRAFEVYNYLEVHCTNLPASVDSVCLHSSEERTTLVFGMTECARLEDFIACRIAVGKALMRNVVSLKQRVRGGR